MGRYPKKANPAPAPATTTAGKVREIVTELLGVDEVEVTPQANLVDDLGADSLDMVELVMGCEERFSIAIEDEQADQVRTVQDLVNLVDRVQAAAQ